MDLAAVDEAGKRWLLERTAALVYPTTSEGFGLVPFEAGEAGVPCLFAAETALGELLPADTALLVPWDAPASARQCIALLSDSAARAEHVAMLRAAGAMLTWRRTANELSDLYEDAIASPARDSRSLVADFAELSSGRSRCLPTPRVASTRWLWWAPTSAPSRHGQAAAGHIHAPAAAQARVRPAARHVLGHAADGPPGGDGSERGS